MALPKTAYPLSIALIAALIAGMMHQNILDILGSNSQVDSAIKQLDPKLRDEFSHYSVNKDGSYSTQQLEFIKAHCSKKAFMAAQAIGGEFNREYHNKRLILRPELAQAMTLGFNRVMADFYWLLFLQYYGDLKACRDENYRYAPDYLGLVVKLDQHFIRAYWFVAFVLAGDMHTQMKNAKDVVGAREILARATDLMDYGIEKNPNDWSLPYIAGFSQYIFGSNDKLAASYYRRAAKIAGAPAWLSRQADILDSGVASKIRKDIFTYTNAWASAKDPVVAQKLADKVELLWSQVYYAAPAGVNGDTIRNRAKERLKTFGLTLLDEKKIPKLETTSDSELKSL